MVRIIVVSMLTLVAGAAPAYAYLDPGTGSLLLQGLVAAVAAGMGAVTIMWHRIKRVLGFEAPQSKSVPDKEENA